MRVNYPVKIVLMVAVLILTLLPARFSVHPAQALSAAIGHFMADCSSFSVDLAVTGTKDDGGGVDYVRYEVRDGVDRLLYQDDAGIPVGTTVGATAIDLVC